MSHTQRITCLAHGHTFKKWQRWYMKTYSIWLQISVKEIEKARFWSQLYCLLAAWPLVSCWVFCSFSANLLNGNDNKSNFLCFILNEIIYTLKHLTQQNPYSINSTYILKLGLDYVFDSFVLLFWVWYILVEICILNT